MKIEKLKPGMKVYSLIRHKMGNTTISTISVYDVNIIDVDIQNCVVTASWNGNAAEKYYGREFNWRLKKPILIGSRMGYSRLANRAEIKAMKEKNSPSPSE